MKIIAVAILCVLSTVAQANLCDRVLVQNTESDRSDNVRAVSSLALVDEQMFNEIKRSSAGNTSASAAYKFFSADFDQSNSYSEFSQRREKTLQKHQFSESVSSSRDNLRQFLSESQLQKWVECKVIESTNGMVVMTATNRALELRSLSLSVIVRLPPERTDGTLSLKLKGAKIEGLSSLDIPVRGSQALVYIVVFDDNSNEALITSRIAGLADDIYLKLSEPIFPAIFEYSTFSFDVCSGHQSGCVGLPSTTTGCHLIEVSNIPRDRHITSVSPNFELGQVIVGKSKAFSLSLSPSESAESDSRAARYIKVCGSSANDENWRQTVKVEVAHKRTRSGQ